MDTKKIFEPLIKDLKILETSDIEINEKLRLKGAVSYFVADNLASNSIGGFVESFNQKVQYCRFCTSSNDYIQNNFVENATSLRSNASQTKSLNELPLINKMLLNILWYFYYSYS